MRWELAGWVGIEAQAGLNEHDHCVGRDFNHVGLIHMVSFPIQTIPGSNEQVLTRETWVCVTMDSKFYTVRFKKQIELGSDPISFHF
jgi:hypothetical protein